MAYWKFRKPGRAKLTVLSRLAAIQIELTIVMRREGSGRRWTADDSDRGNKSNSGGDDSFDFRFDRVWELKAWLKNVPVITAIVQSTIIYRAVVSAKIYMHSTASIGWKEKR